jgi:3-methyladenine DNA glycosylase/8-oxoguanine DNA glycosylase
MRVVREESAPPKGSRFDPARVLRRPMRALRGGADGLAVGFAWRSRELVISVLASGACNDDDAAFALDRARKMSGIDDDPDAFLRQIAEHRVLGRLSRAFDARLVATPTLFESLAEALIGQLGTAAEASASVARLWKLAGEAILGTDLRAAPTHEGVRRVPMWKMHGLGIGSRRAATLNACAKRGEAIERLRALPAETVVEKLTSLPGVGPWTANLAALHGLAWADAVPVGDLHAPRVVTKALLGEERDDAAMLEALEPFRPHRARAARLLMHTQERTGPRPKIDPHRREPWKF